jgi:flap endonuclease-1
MGVLLTPIIKKQVLSLNDLKGKSFAVDAFIVLYQFMSLIRTKNGAPLSDKEGNVTSHLVGLSYRTTRLISDHGMKLVFVFDGTPPQLKKNEVDKRREAREKAEKEYKEALKTGDIETAMHKAVMTSKLTPESIIDAKHLLDLLGIPWVQAPSEGEAQAAYMAAKGDVWATNSRDYDSLLFGTPRLLRYLTIGGEEWLPSKGKSRKLHPELIKLDQLLSYLKISRKQLIDLGILVGTDFNDGLKGIGPVTALKLIREHGRLEDLPFDIKDRLPDTFESIREIYLKPKVTPEYSTEQKELREEELFQFLCDERDFSRNRVKVIVERIKKPNTQRSLSDFMGCS